MSNSLNFSHVLYSNTLDNGFFIIGKVTERYKLATGNYPNFSTETENG